MRGAVQLAATAVAAFCAGCATSLDVSYDETEDFSRYRTWDWLPGGRNVEALPGEDRALDSLTSRLVARELRDRGLERVDDEPDFLVGYQLQVYRQLLAVNETGASSYLASHHASPSYIVQTTTSRVDVYDHAHLRFMVTDGRREKMLWRGDLSARRKGDFAHHLSDAVAELLDRLPVGNSTLQPATAAASQ
jgi:hypothetical protein